MPELPEIPEDFLKRSRSHSSPRSFILAIGIVLALSCASSLPASAEAPRIAGGAIPLPLSGAPSLFTTATSTGEEEKPAEEPFEPEVIREGPPEPTILDTMQAGITKNILHSATWVDSFFYDPRYAAEENKTRAAVRYEGFIENHAHWTFDTKVKVALVLPYLKNKANLILAGDPDEAYPSQPGQGRLTETTNRNTFAALAYQVRSDERRNISAKIGIRYRNGQIVSFLRPHYRLLYHLDGWDLRFTQEFPYWTDTKWSSSTTVDLERPLRDAFFFRASLNGSWFEQQPGYYYGLAFSLSQPLSATSALSYNLGASFQTGAHDVLQESRGCHPLSPALLA